MKPKIPKLRKKQGIVHELVHLHDGRLVPAAVAVVRRREDRHHGVGVHPAVALHYQLVRARDQREAVVVVEPRSLVLAERVPGAAR